MTTTVNAKVLQALEAQLVEEVMGIYPTTVDIPELELEEEEEGLGFDVAGLDDPIGEVELMWAAEYEPDALNEYPSYTITDDGDLVHTSPLSYDHEAPDAEYDAMLDEDDTVIYADNIPAERELTPSEERSARVGQGIILRAVQGDTKALMMLRDAWELYHKEIITVMYWLASHDQARIEAVDDTIYLIDLMSEHRGLTDTARCANYTVTALIQLAIVQQDAGAQQLLTLLWPEHRDELMAKMAEMVAQGFLPEDAVYDAENLLDLETTPATASMYRLAAAKIRQAG